MKTLKVINTWLGENKLLIETIGIISGVFILILTYSSTISTKKSLELALKQDVDNQLPVWDWELNDSLSFVKLRPTNSNVKIQIAKAYFPKKYFKDGIEWPLNQPDYKFYLLVFKWRMADIIVQHIKYNPNKMMIGGEVFFPFGLEVNYVQYGTARSVKGIFAIQFTMVRGGQTPSIHIDGIIFNHYLDSNQDLKEEVDKFAANMSPLSRLNKTVE